MLTVFIRSVLLVCLAVCALRLMGKRQVGQLQPFELVIAIMIADLAATPMESLDTPLWRGVVPMAALVMLHQIFSLLSLKSQKMRRFFSGSPTIIIRNGRIDYQALEKLCFNLNDLLEELRTGGVLSPTEVGTAIMETSGKLSVFPTARKRPVTPEDMKLPTGYEGVPLTLILDGQLERNNLPLLGKDESWLQKQLGELGFSEIRQVLLCYIDTDGVMSVHGFRGEPPKRRQTLSAGEVKW